MTDDTGPSDVEEIRRLLRSRREYVDDPELRDEIQSWIDKSHETTDADTVGEYVSARLTELLGEYPMYMASSVDSASEAFPAECLECDHYGAACPVLVGPVEPDFRERKLAGAGTQAEERQVMERQATDTGCLRIPDFLNEWESEYADHVAEGERLLKHAEEQTRRGLDAGTREEERP